MLVLFEFVIIIHNSNISINQSTITLCYKKSHYERDMLELFALLFIIKNIPKIAIDKGRFRVLKYLFDTQTQCCGYTKESFQ